MTNVLPDLAPVDTDPALSSAIERAADGEHLTPADHYRLAEHHLWVADQTDNDYTTEYDDMDAEQRAVFAEMVAAATATAHVHAILATVRTGGES